MNLELQIREIQASAPPYRALSLACSVHNKINKEVAILEAWVTVKTGGNSMLADGFHFQQYNAPAYRATIPSGEKGSGRILIPLSSHLLKSIEEERQEKDLELIIHSRVLITHIEQIQPLSGAPVYTLGLPWETCFSAMGSSPVSYKIPQSNWIKLLSYLRWSELELFEIPMETFSSDPNLQRAIELLREAQNRFSRGDWRGTLQNCRQAFEAAAADIGKTEDKKENFMKLLDGIGGGKSEKLNDFVLSLSAFAHLGRHEQIPTVHITREDALFTLRCTLSAFTLLGGRVY